MYIVYKATHNSTGKIYIGYTKKELQERIGQHWGTIESKRAAFQTFLHTTRMSDWSWEILHTFENYKDARDCEMYYIRMLKCYSYGLNLSTGIGSSKMESIKKISGERMKAYRAANPEPWNKGRKGVYSEETLDRMSLAKLKNPTRRTFTDEDKLEASFTQPSRKEVVDLETGLVFSSIASAARCFGLSREKVRDVVGGKRRHTGGRVFRAL